MNPAMTQVRCPRCGMPAPATVEQVIDVAVDPGAKARLLSGSLNHVRCPSCGYDGMLAMPIVFHDPTKELLLTYFPVELGLPQAEQERVLGRLINQVINRLPAEKRKAYLLQPQAVLTMQGLVDRILQADGITREEVEAQRAKLRLFEDLLRVPDDQMERFVAEHDAELDEVFFQLATLALRNAPEERAQKTLADRIDRAISASSFGKRILAQEGELRAAAQSLQDAGPDLTREKLLNLAIAAPNKDRLAALASLARPAMDYTFFSLLTDRIDKAAGPEKDRLATLRAHLLEATQRIDEAQQAQVARAAELLKQVAGAKDLDRALQAVLPLVDEVFLGVLEANLRAARERADAATASRLEEISSRLQALVRDSLPPGIRLAQTVLEMESEDEARAALEAASASIDGDLLGALMSAAESLEKEGDREEAERLRRLHRHAVGISMRARMASKGGKG
jgi:hypothetical protein